MVPTTEHPKRIVQALRKEGQEGERLLWIGGNALEGPDGLILHTPDDAFLVDGLPAERQWLWEVIDAARPNDEPLRLSDAAEAFPGDWDRYHDRWQKVRQAGMLLV